MIDNQQKICTTGKSGILEYSNLLEKVNKHVLPVSITYVQENIKY